MLESRLPSKYVHPVPLQVLLLRQLRSDWQEQLLAQRRAPIEVSRHLIRRNGRSQSGRNRSPKVVIHRHQSRVECDVMSRTRRNSVPHIEAFPVSTGPPGLNVSGQQHPPTPKRRRPEPAKDTSFPTVTHDV